MATPLKPCPFCGSFPRIDTSGWAHNKDQEENLEFVEQRTIITCKKCFLKKDIINTGYMLTGQDEKAYRKFAKYLATETIELMWNKRVNNG